VISVEELGTVREKRGGRQEDKLREGREKNKKWWERKDDKTKEA
jgi:hypothetical protein